MFKKGLLFFGTQTYVKKSLNLPSGTLLSLSSYVDIEYNSAESLTNKYKFFGTKSKQTVNFSNIPKTLFSLTP